MICVDKASLVLGMGWSSKDTADHLPCLLYFVTNIGRITIDLLTLGSLSTALHADNLASFVHNLLDRFVQHVGSTVDRRQTGKTLWELTQAVQRIQVGRLSISS